MVKNLTLIALILWLSACSVYKSNGRKAFESNSAGNTNAASISSLSFDEEDVTLLKNETCWNQPSGDPLWNLDSTTLSENQTTELVVKRMTASEIQVCTRPID